MIKWIKSPECNDENMFIFNVTQILIDMLKNVEHQSSIVLPEKNNIHRDQTKNERIRGLLQITENILLLNSFVISKGYLPYISLINLLKDKQPNVRFAYNKFPDWIRVKLGQVQLKCVRKC